MSLEEATACCDQLRAEFAKDQAKAKLTLEKLKTILVKLNILFPTSTNQKELLLTREVLEMGALLSISSHDVDSFERYMAQLATFYREFKEFMPESPRMFMLLGLNLLRLLAQTRISEFHTELEAIGSQNLKNVYIQHPVSIEQALMEGSYNKVWRARSDVPAKEYSFFMDILAQTIRHEIAKCSEKAYADLPLSDAVTLLYFKTEAELLAFAKERNWKVEGKQIVFGNSSQVDQDIPVQNVIHNMLNYAMELERIV